MNKKNGYTLVEIIVVIVILGILSAVGGTLLSHSFEAGYISQNHLEATQNAQFAFARMSDDLQEANSITTLNANDITFKTIDNNTISYSLSSGNLLRNTNILSTNITGLSFTYLNESNTDTTDAASIRCIVISATFNKNDSSIPITSTVCPRNLAL